MSMIIFTTWISLLLYTLSWISSLTLKNKKFSLWIESQTLRLGWIIHTVVLFYTLIFVSNWPITFVEDFMNLMAWICLVISQAFSFKWNSLFQNSILRVFSILLLGLSASFNQTYLQDIISIQNNSWIFGSILVLHILTFIAGYVFFGTACIASILFLYQEQKLKAKLTLYVSKGIPPLGSLDKLNMRATQWGFVFLTIGIILGIALNEEPRNGFEKLRLALSMSIWSVYAFLILIREMKLSPNRWYMLLPIIGFITFLSAIILEWFKLSTN